MKDLFQLDEQLAVVVGGTGELGGKMAEALGAFGAKVAIVGRNADRGNARAKAICDAGGEARFFVADGLLVDSLRTAREQINGWSGRSASVLVNAAGGNQPAATMMPGDNFCELPLDAWQSVFDLNLLGGTLLPTQIFGQDMIDAGHGSVINIASMSGMIPLSRVVAYSAAKAAVINLTMWLVREWASNGVRVNAISPGFFPAEQNRKLLIQEDGSYTERGSQIIGHTPMRRFGEAQELAGVVIWLASDRASSFVTGQNIPVDGGFASVTI